MPPKSNVPDLGPDRFYSSFFISLHGRESALNPATGIRKRISKKPSNRINRCGCRFFTCPCGQVLCLSGFRGTFLVHSLRFCRAAAGRKARWHGVYLSWHRGCYFCCRYPQGITSMSRSSQRRQTVRVIAHGAGSPCSGRRWQFVTMAGVIER